MYTDISTGLLHAVSTVPQLKVILDYEPNALHDAPAFYLTLVSFKRQQHGGVTAMRYFCRGRIAVKWTDNERAEQELALLVNQVPMAIEADQQLGLQRVIVAVTDGQAQYMDISGVTYRVLDLLIDALEKGAGTL